MSNDQKAEVSSQINENIAAAVAVLTLRGDEDLIAPHIKAKD